MPRIARVVAPGVAHHITQRGTNRQIVFYSRRDRKVYLDLLRDNAVRAHVRILAYCLMRNHIHVIAIPGTEDGLAICLRRTHGRYAQYLNARRGRSGHLWQNRFFSCPVESGHLNHALRYVERNPVRAGIVQHPEQYLWSSAAAHLSGDDRQRLLDLAFWTDTGGAPFWRQLLGAEEDENEIRRLRTATYAGRPLGNEEFASRLRGAEKWQITAG